MGKLSDILANGNGEELCRKWNSTEVAEDFGPLPSGEYIARIIDGRLFAGRTNGTPGYKLTFKVLEGDHAGRQFWHDIWLTPAALPMAKRDLGKLGVTDIQQLERSLPPGIRCRVALAVRRDDDGTEFNRVRRFDVLGIEKPEPDAFAPSTPADAGMEEGAGDLGREAKDNSQDDDRQAADGDSQVASAEPSF
jgi:hypothetical protein